MGSSEPMSFKTYLNNFQSYNAQDVVRLSFFKTKGGQYGREEDPEERGH